MRRHNVETKNASSNIPPEEDFIECWEYLGKRCGYNTERLAKMLHVSVATLDAHFKKCSATGVRQYLEDLQMADAYSELLAGKSSEQVAFDLGWTHPFQFAKKFELKFGISPAFVESPFARADNSPATYRRA